MVVTVKTLATVRYKRDAVNILFSLYMSIFRVYQGYIKSFELYLLHFLKITTE